MSELIISKVFNQFDFNGIPSRVIQDDKENFWWVTADICKALSINNPSHAVYGLDDNEKSTIIINESLVNQGFSVNSPGTSLGIVNESGLYSLLFKSRKPEAKRFIKWVTGEVIPSIRKNGYYSVNQQGADQKVGRVRKKPAKTLLDQLLPEGISFAMIERDVRKLNRLYGQLGFADQRQMVVDQIAALYGDSVRSILSPCSAPVAKLPQPEVGQGHGGDTSSVRIEPFKKSSLPICPTDIAEASGLPSAQVVNLILLQTGYQVKSMTSGSPAWVPTRKGLAFSMVRSIPLGALSNDKGHDNREIHQLMWSHTIMDQPDFIAACQSMRTRLTPSVRRMKASSGMNDMFGRSST